MLPHRNLTLVLGLMLPHRNLTLVLGLMLPHRNLTKPSSEVRHMKRSPLAGPPAAIASLLLARGEKYTS